MQEELVADERKFKSLLLGVGVEFIHKLKKLAADRSADGSPVMTDEPSMRELVRLNPDGDPQPCLDLRSCRTLRAETVLIVKQSAGCASSAAGHEARARPGEEEGRPSDPDPKPAALPASDLCLT